MLLENYYFKVEKIIADNQKADFHIQLNSDCNIYEGHFPGRHVCPGVCNIETIKECVIMMTNEKLFISNIRQCRLTAVATPSTCHNLTIHIELEPTNKGYGVIAVLKDENNTYMHFKGEMSKI